MLNRLVVVAGHVAVAIGYGLLLALLRLDLVNLESDLVVDVQIDRPTMPFEAEDCLDRLALRVVLAGLLENSPQAPPVSVSSFLRKRYKVRRPAHLRCEAGCCLLTCCCSGCYGVTPPLMIPVRTLRSPAVVTDPSPLMSNAF